MRAKPKPKSPPEPKYQAPPPLTNREAAEAFSRHAFKTVYPQMQDIIRWELVGEQTLHGKGPVMALCEQLSDNLIGITVTFEQFDVRDEGDYLEINSRAAYTEPTGHVSRVQARDEYTFEDGELAVITSENEEVE